MANRCILGALAFAALLVISGCGASGARFKDPQVPSGTTPLPVRVLVVPFEDERDFDQKPAQIKSSAPLTIARSFSYDRPDEAYTAAGKPFPERLAEELAEDIAESGLVEKVTYARHDRMPEKGTYDLILKGKLLKTEQSGRVYLYGLVLPLGIYLYDVAWYLGLPKTRRDYDIETELQWYNGYDDTPIGVPVRSSYDTPGKTFWVYSEEGRMDDVSKRVKPSWNDFVDATVADLPGGGDSHWAALKSEGVEHMARIAREEEFRRKGAPPVFAFISPDTGSTVRATDANVRWNISAPNGLKTARLTLGGSSVELGLASFDLSSDATAPRSVAARTVNVPLELGENELVATVTDWRGNETTAELRISRLPQPLQPADRHALLIGMGSDAAVNTVRELERAVTDPFAGQFEKSRVTAITSPEFDPARIESVINEFGAGPIGDQLAMIYIAAPGTASSMSLGSGSDAMPLTRVAEILERQLATDVVFVVLDVEWDATADGEVLDTFDDAPPRWGVATSATTPKAGAVRASRFAYGSTMADLLTERRSGDSALTIERFFDEVAARAEDSTGLEPDLAGRFDPNATMVSYQ